ncbi:uncharacterized protein LOC135486723 isoform X2 [Lineus longissimus]
MSMDFLKTTYRPAIPRDTKSRTSYSQMNSWMQMPPMEKKHIVQFGGASNIPPPVHLQYYKSGGYDDAHKAFRQLENQNLANSYPHYGPPRLRNGHVGGSWRHMKEVLQAGGRRIVFVDGQITNDDRHRSERVPHGDMIRPIIRKHNNDEHTAMADHQPDTLPRRQRIRQLNMTAYRATDTEGQRAREKVNWCVMR